MTVAEFLRERNKDPDAVQYAQYVAIANEIEQLTPSDTGLSELRLAVLRNITVEPLVPVLAGEILAAGFHPTIFLGEFDAMEADAMNPAGPLYTFAPDFVFVVNWLDAVSNTFARRFVGMDATAAAVEADRIVDRLAAVLQALAEHTSAPVIVNNFPAAIQPSLGILDAQASQFQTGLLAQMNERIRDEARKGSRAFVIDYARLFAQIGSANAVDERYWQMARAPIASKALAALGREYAKFIRALRGGAKKCLVLDCDNTLWGGTIGEDGMAGIKIGSTYPASAFLAFQEEILNLHDRGVILAICSKNNRGDVLEVLREHPDMLLRESHFASMQINWDDKATNLRRIADELNIGTDSLVFVDDNAFEIGLVRDSMPDVAVIHLPERAYSTYRALLLKDGYFDSLSYTAEDRRKNEMYAQEHERKERRATAPTLEEYLQKLGVHVEIGAPSAIDIPRISQLTQKTNQFNLTTRRYSEAEIAAFASGPASEVLYVKVADTVSDLGLVGVAILNDGNTALIDTLAMSCRSLGRGVEDALLAALAARAREMHGSLRIVGVFRATAKNAQVESFYQRHGFRRIAERDGEISWEHAVGKDPLIANPSWIALTTTEATHAG